MDSVEIVIAVEEAFGIQIEDSEAEKLLTPQQLIDVVMSKVASARSEICLTHRSFNLLRASFMRHCALKRRDITPES